MTSAEKVTGTHDEHDDLISVLYHTMQEAETLQTYIDDARSPPAAPARGAPQRQAHVTCRATPAPRPEPRLWRGYGGVTGGSAHVRHE